MKVRKGRALTVMVGAALLMAPLVLTVQPTASAAATSKNVRVHLDGIVSKTLADGSTLTQKREGGYTQAKLHTLKNGDISVSGPAGSTIVATFTSDPTKRAKGSDQDPGTAEVSLEVPDDKLAGVDPQQKIQDRQAQGRSVVIDAMATGMTYEDAANSFGDMEPSIPSKSKALAVLNGKVSEPSTATSVVPTGPTSATSSTTLAPVRAVAAAAPVVWDSACVDFVGGPANHAKSHACTVRYMDYSVSGDWYLSNKMKMTASVVDWWYRMIAGDVWTEYNAGNSWVDWEPSRTYSQGSCSTLTLGVNDPKTGASISYASQICPSSLSPVWTNGALGFGGIWRGGSTDDENAIAVGVLHNPPGKSAAYSVHTWINWG